MAQEKNIGAEWLELAKAAAKAGVCKYREKCHIYQRTAKKGIQQKIEFDL